MNIIGNIPYRNDSSKDTTAVYAIYFLRLSGQKVLGLSKKFVLFQRVVMIQSCRK